MRRTQPLTTAHGGVLGALVEVLSLRNRVVSDENLLGRPISEELAEASAEDDHDDDISVVGHGDEHQDVGDGESGGICDGI